MTDPTISALPPALALFRHDWVHKFFFETTPSETLEQLDYALKDPCILTGNMSVNCDPCPQSQPQPQSQPHLLEDSIRGFGNFMFAPSFTTSTITVGFEVSDRLLTTFPLLRFGKFMSRAVRDDEQGIILSISENESCGVTELSFCTRISPGCRSMSIMLFDKNAFRYIITNKCDEQLVQKSLLFSLYNLEVRPCPICNAQTFINCTCRLAFHRKMHPLDYGAEIQNLASYVSAFEGFTNLHIYEDGKPTFVRDFMANFSTTVTSDAYLRQSMSVWAMEDATKNCSMNLLKLVVPDGRPDVEGELKDTLEDHFMGPDEESLVGNGGEFGLSDEEIMRLVTGLHDGCASYLDANGGNEKVTSFYASGADTLNTCSERLMSSIDGVNGLASDDDIFELLEKPNGKSMEDLSAKRSSSRTPDAPEVEAPNQTAVPSIRVEPQGGTNEQAYVIEHIRMKKVIPIAPAADSCSVRASTLEAERQRKAEVRKAKNRESALRSNEKKRIYMMKLKDDIDSAGKVEAALRAKEKVLREENRKLRACIKR